MTKGIYFSLTGASGSGKSTLLKYVSDNYYVETKELSARKFLDSNKGSYDNQMNDELEVKIDYHYLKETYSNILLAQKGINIMTTRCLLDSLAYTYSLKSAEFLIPQMEEILKEIKNDIIFLFTPCDFPMTQKEDKLRGMNEEVRQKTNDVFIFLLNKLNIPYILVGGDLQTRKSIIDKVMTSFLIMKKEK